MKKKRLYNFYTIGNEKREYLGKYYIKITPKKLEEMRIEFFNLHNEGRVDIDFNSFLDWLMDNGYKISILVEKSIEFEY